MFQMQNSVQSIDNYMVFNHSEITVILTSSNALLSLLTKEVTEIVMGSGKPLCSTKKIFEMMAEAKQTFILN